VPCYAKYWKCVGVTVENARRKAYLEIVDGIVSNENEEKKEAVILEVKSQEVVRMCEDTKELKRNC